MTETSDSRLSEAPVPPALRIIKIALAALLTLGSLAWSANLFRMVGLLPVQEQFLAGMLGTALGLVFLVYPARKKRGNHGRVPVYDYVLSILGFGTGAYAALALPQMLKAMEGVGGVPANAFIVACIFLVLCLEGLRRTVGLSLLLIVIFFIGYGLVGHNFSGAFETRPQQIDWYLTYLSIDTSSLFGFAMKVGATIVITFVFFGQLLVRSGGSQFFNDISLVLMGRYRGGSAKISIMASSLFGSVSGVAVSNIVATGVITIPLMKRDGFSPTFAASVEAVASTGGQLMPPVMGAVAFLMADFLEKPYQDIVFAAIVPSFLYYVALFIQADLEAARAGISRIDAKNIPVARFVLRRGWYFALPFAALIYALFFLNWEAETAAILASGVTILVGIAVGYGAIRMKLKDIWGALVETGYSVLDILMIVAGAGFIIGALQVTGLGFGLTVLLTDVGEGNLLLLLLILGALCIVMGMGMPTAGVYILLAILFAPSLVEVGVLPIAAHMFILYLGMMSLITPPVAVASFFAASIAKAPPMRTGWYSMRFGWTAYVVPFLFVFSPSLLLQGDSPAQLILDVSSAIAGVWIASAAVAGYFARVLPAGDRILFAVAGALLLAPHGLAPWIFWLNGAGLVLGILAVARNVMIARRGRQPLAPARE